MNDPEDTINNSKAGRRAAMARDGRLESATADTQHMHVDDMIRAAKAAPEMLAALRRLEAVAFDAEANGVHQNLTTLRQELTAACAQARAVIAKATGKL
jgi:hypothetical protein